MSSCYTDLMVTESDKEYLTHRREILEMVASVITERDRMIRKLLDTGESPTELAKLAGLTRARIYQIKDSRPK